MILTCKDKYNIAYSIRSIEAISTTAVVRFIKATVPKTDIISSINYHNILRQLLILFSIAYPITYDRLSYYLQQPTILAGISQPIFVTTQHPYRSN